ncbi:MAG: CoA transferase [Escherichia coli]|nr:CoA transferase [Escherichia coli]
MDHLPMPKFGPLAGLRVVFSGIEIAGPFAGQMFAEWGAEVIWIENVAWADTIRVQPNYPQLSRRNLHALGTEEYTNLPAYNTIAQAFSGYLIQNGDVDQPMPAFPYTADYFSGLTATTAALAALHKVRETGKGESIDIAMYEVMLRMGQYFMMDYFNGGEMCPRMSKGKDPYYAGCGLYKCADGYIVMELVGITQIEEKLDAWLAAHTIAEVKERFAELNIACAKVLTVPELESNPQYVARESITQWQTMDGRTCKGPNIMPKFKNNPGQIWRGMPSHGMDTAAILKNIGYSENDIQELVSKGLAKVED